MTTLAPLRSVTWTDFHDTTLTSTQINDINNIVTNEAVISSALSTAITNMPNGPFVSLTIGTPPQYATFSSEAAATAAIQNAPINSAFSFTTPSGAVRFMLKNSGGAIYAGSYSPANLSASGFTHILVSPLNPANRAPGLELNEIFKIARAISPTFTLASVNTLAGTSYTGTEVLTSAMAQNLLNSISTNKAILASKLSVEQGGGVKYVNGQWYLAGKLASFFDVYLRVRVNQLVNIDTGTTSYINSIQKRNNLITQANYFLSQLNAIMPTTTDGTVSFEKIFNGGPTVLRPAFITKYGFDPFIKFAPTAFAAIANKDVWNNVTSGAFTQAQMEAWATEIKSFISSRQTDTTSDQTQLQTLADKRTEVFDAVTNVTKSNGQISADIGRNMT